jgi:phage tail-like protein
VRSGVLPVETPAPLAARLPGLYKADGGPNFGQRFLAALDDVLAPVFLAVDSLPAYLDPMLAPDDFLDWLADWLGLPLDKRWSLERRRALVSQASLLYRVRGTAEGVDWLVCSLGLALDERWARERRRLVSQAAALYQLRGTAEGVAQHVEALYGIRPEVTESGGVAWSTTAEGRLPGDDSQRMTVRVPAGGELDPERLRALVDSIRPAHITADVVIE